MQIILDLPDEIAQELQTLPNAELFVTELVKAALQRRKTTPQEYPLGTVEGKLKVHASEDFTGMDEASPPPGTKRGLREHPAFGHWKNKHQEGLDYQYRLRDEWSE